MFFHKHNFTEVVEKVKDDTFNVLNWSVYITSTSGFQILPLSWIVSWTGTV